MIPHAAAWSYLGVKLQPKKIACYPLPVTKISKWKTLKLYFVRPLEFEKSFDEKGVFIIPRYVKTMENFPCLKYQIVALGRSAHRILLFLATKFLHF